ncbi:MAG: valine--tRNA ligase [Candidatus Bathyarchaeia archaeon]|jgi:valyl-tRNA synthetase
MKSDEEVSALGAKGRVRQEDMRLPPRYEQSVLEASLQKDWEEGRIYEYDRKNLSRPTYSIDTPPPYPSGEFHMGNALNWCYFDFVARYKRMRGYNVHFPQGWDCHGLPTEVRAERTFNIRKRDVSIEKFREICAKLTTEYIEKMKAAMQSMGYSIDWSLEYRTMDPEYYKLTQLSFLQLLRRGLLYKGEHPVNWCPRCETAIAEAEVEYVRSEGTLIDIRFSTEKGNLIVATSRPEFVPACVALAVNPTDSRYLEYVGKVATVPLCDRKIPILKDELVDASFGSGVVMICTFGDKTDVRWQRKYHLPVVKLLDAQGRLTQEAGKYAGLQIQKARVAIVEDLRNASGIGDSKTISREIGTCWRCHTPVEILSAPQWFMKTKDMTDQIVDWTNRVAWVPDFSKNRMIEWARSLDWDWVISRQRLFGTPIPVWYCRKCGQTLPAEDDWLPVDPRSQHPRTGSCPHCGSADFVGDQDVMDTWMDSSITCAVHAGWPDRPDEFQRLFPADLQPNGLDIIRTWDYYLMARHLALFGKAPYKTVLVNGMVRGADGRMMHKSYGNYVEVTEAITKYGADSVRQWAAAGGSTGYDIPYRWADVEYGRKFLTKLWNAARLILSSLRDYDPTLPAPKLDLLDRWLLSKLNKLVGTSTDAFENFQFSLATESVRNFTWHDLCDQYLEAAKYRLYADRAQDDENRRASQYTLFHTLDVVLRLLAPICPHITDALYRELWSDHRKNESIHLGAWPQPNINLIDEISEKNGSIIIRVLSEIRRIKSEKRLSMKAPIKKLKIELEEDAATALVSQRDAIQQIAVVEQVEIVPIRRRDGKELPQTDSDFRLSAEF